MSRGYRRSTSQKIISALPLGLFGNFLRVSKNFCDFQKGMSFCCDFDKVLRCAAEQWFDFLPGPKIWIEPCAYLVTLTGEFGLFSNSPQNRGEFVRWFWDKSHTRRRTGRKRQSHVTSWLFWTESNLAGDFGKVITFRGCRTGPSYLLYPYSFLTISFPCQHGYGYDPSLFRFSPRPSIPHYLRPRPCSSVFERARRYTEIKKSSTFYKLLCYRVPTTQIDVELVNVRTRSQQRLRCVWLPFHSCKYSSIHYCCPLLSLPSVLLTYPLKAIAGRDSPLTSPWNCSCICVLEEAGKHPMLL